MIKLEVENFGIFRILKIINFSCCRILYNKVLISSRMLYLYVNKPSSFQQQLDFGSSNLVVEQ